MHSISGHTSSAQRDKAINPKIISFYFKTIDDWHYLEYFHSEHHILCLKIIMFGSWSHINLIRYVPEEKMLVSPFAGDQPACQHLEMYLSPLYNLFQFVSPGFSFGIGMDLRVGGGIEHLYGANKLPITNKVKKY